jgi:hypothetical protein
VAYSVLAIAPLVTGLAPLATAAELACIGDLPGVQLTQLTGPVTKQRVIDRLGKGSYNAVLWAGHGTPGHLVIEGDTVDPRWLAVQLKQAKISLVVLAACQSGARPAISEFVASFADVLPPAGISAIVMMIDVEDRSAIEYDVALFQALASGATVRASHETGIEKIAHNPAMAQAPMLIPADRINGDFVTLQQHVGDLGKALASNDLQAAHKLIGDTVAALDRIDDRIIGIERTVTRHGARLDSIERKINPPWNVTAWRALAALIVLFGLVMGASQRAVLFELYPFTGIVLEGVLLFAAAACLLLANAKLKERSL